MEYDCPHVAAGMSMERVRSVLGEPDRTHVLRCGEDFLTSWIYHTEPDPMCVWFDSADRVKMTSRNCSARPVAVR